MIEVKGGTISADYRSKKWTSTSAAGRTYDINNPFEQAKKGKYGLLEKLKESPAWQKLGIRRFNLGHAVFFPEAGNVDRLSGPDAPRELLGDERNLGKLSTWLEHVFTFWEGDQGNTLDKIGDRGVEVVVNIFARVATTKSLMSARNRSEEEQRVELTRRQAQVLNLLQRQRRVMIVGGAGTGKTLIAREKAARLASEGLNTLLVCYNRGLSDHLREQCNDLTNLDVASFHQVCHNWITKARTATGRDFLGEARQKYPGAGEFDQLMPIALANAVNDLGPIYDAIVADEGQDFGNEFWLPIEMLLTRPNEGMLYVFLDENQDIYRRSAEIPIKNEPMVLDANCRNTAAIHTAAYRYYRGSPVHASVIVGTKIELINANGIERQARNIGSLVTRLIAEEKIAPHDIAVLLCDGRLKVDYERALRKVMLPAKSRFDRLEGYGPGVVTVDTVARFKGLERAIIILCAFDSCTPIRDRETLYVGMSRAKSVLYFCGSTEAFDRILSAEATN